jgi:diketogulonate reductase-like aldo/keto reductase
VGFGSKAVPTGIDTAFNYGDQPVIGNILKKRSTPRENVFLTTKVPAGFGNTTDCIADPNITVRYVQENLLELGVDQVDLVLIHRPCQPHGSAKGPVPVGTTPAQANQALWDGAVEVLKMGLTRTIGVSNYAKADLEALDMSAAVPSVNQCQLSVAHHDDATMIYCKAKGIQYEAFFAMKGCPFSGTGSDVVSAIATKHGKSVSQVCLRWILQRGSVMAVGTGANATTAAAYAKENLNIFDFSLSADEVKQLNSLQH